MNLPKMIPQIAERYKGYSKQIGKGLPKEQSRKSHEHP